MKLTSHSSSLRLLFRAMVSALLALGAPAHVQSHSSENSKPSGEEPSWFGASAAVLSKGESRLYLAGERSDEIVEIDLQSKNRTRSFQLGRAPCGLAVGDRPDLLLITCAGWSNQIVSLDLKTGEVTECCSTRQGATSPIVKRGQHQLYVCNRYDGSVSRIDLRTGGEQARVQGLREPVAASLSHDFTALAVANLLPTGRADQSTVSAAVTVLDPMTLQVRELITLPNGSSAVRGIAFHPKSNLCAVAHSIARFRVPTTQVEHGWMSVSAVSLFQAGFGSAVATVVLDEANHGAADPWAVSWTGDGSYLVVTHAGSQELSIIDAPLLLRKLGPFPIARLVTDFGFLEGVRKRVALKGNGPRVLAMGERTAYVAEFFSDSVSVVDLDRGTILYSMKLREGAAETQQRIGERLFNDATIGHQSWHSCTSCHPDGRADGFNWDLLNDGIGNPKNTKSLVGSHQTPPAMWAGVRQSAETAVRSGLRHILFALRPEADAVAIDEYLKSLRPIPSPHLIDGQNLSEQAQHGREIFAAAGCATCHPPGLFTDQKSHDVGTAKLGPKESAKFDTQGLAELWRTAPYLHNGSAATVRDVVTERNRDDRHGKTSGLSAGDIDALVEYLLSL